MSCCKDAGTDEIKQILRAGVQLHPLPTLLFFQDQRANRKTVHTIWSLSGGVSELSRTSTGSMDISLPLVEVHVFNPAQPAYQKAGRSGNTRSLSFCLRGIPLLIFRTSLLLIQPELPEDCLKRLWTCRTDGDRTYPHRGGGFTPSPNVSPGSLRRL